MSRYPEILPMLSIMEQSCKPTLSFFTLRVKTVPLVCTVGGRVDNLVHLVNTTTLSRCTCSIDSHTQVEVETALIDSHSNHC